MASEHFELKEKIIKSTDDSISQEIPSSGVSESEKNIELESYNIHSSQAILKESELPSGEEKDSNKSSTESSSNKKLDKKIDDNFEENSLIKENIIGSTESNSSGESLSSLEDSIILDDSGTLEDLLDPLEETAGQKRKRETDETFPRKVEIRLELDKDSLDGEQMSFSDAEKRIRKLKRIPSDSDVILAYALHKQSVEGDNETEYPLPLDFVGKVKWETWNNLKGVSKEVAKKKYINLVKQLELDT